MQIMRLSLYINHMKQYLFERHLDRHNPEPKKDNKKEITERIESLENEINDNLREHNMDCALIYKRINQAEEKLDSQERMLLRLQKEMDARTNQNSAISYILDKYGVDRLRSSGLLTGEEFKILKNFRNAKVDDSEI